MASNQSARENYFSCGIKIYDKLFEEEEEKKTGSLTVEVKLLVRSEKKKGKEKKIIKKKGTSEKKSLGKLRGKTPSFQKQTSVLFTFITLFFNIIFSFQQEDKGINSWIVAAQPGLVYKMLSKK